MIPSKIEEQVISLQQHTDFVTKISRLENEICQQVLPLRCAM